MARDEAAGWIQSFTRYRASGSDESAWLQIYNARSIRVDRKAAERPHVRVKQAAVSFCGAASPTSGGA
jgi:hypothetical protein